MKKYLLLLMMSLLSFQCLAFVNVKDTQHIFASEAVTDCGRAVLPNAANFCSSFKTVAKCHCDNASLSPVVCNSMKEIYAQMIDVYKTVEAACERGQKEIPTQDCIDSWHCYGSGGRDSHGNLCRSNGHACEKIT